MSEKGKQDFDGVIDGVGYKRSMDDPSKPPMSWARGKMTCSTPAGGGVEMSSMGWPSAPGEAARRVRAAGLEFDPEAGTGAVLLMLSGLAIDGRLCAVAIGRDAAEAGRRLAALPGALGG